ncbi:hypothetical protein WICPIJ_006592 [Wickerhamomyces pijperi]|uniref:Peptide transporter PTR2 n=1 Tax=Wickerhamomyces pijperi TaxID=599730 RepID=A0A9P8Q3Q1_WICPI|nr:hypothetical protein WICPIJ_006592 [Wickerhamomyces pijperi]
MKVPWYKKPFCSEVQEKKFQSKEDLAEEIVNLQAYNEQFPEPTQEDYAILKSKKGSLGFVLFLTCIIEAAERASFYGVKDRINNFVQLPLPAGGNGVGAPPKGTQLNSGALGLGLQAASGIVLLLTFLCYITPLFGGYIADKRWGRLKTIWWGVIIGLLSHILLVFAAIPGVIDNTKAALPITIISIVLLSFGSGFIKPNLLPLLMDQYPHKRDVVVVDEKTHERYILSRDETLQSIASIFYWSINIGGFFSIATSYCAKRIGFWLAFLLPGGVYVVMIPILLVLRRKLKLDSPSGVSVMGESMKVIRYSFKKGAFKRLRTGQFWTYAKPSAIQEHTPSDLTKTDKKNKKNKKISWDDEMVDNVKITIKASAFFLFFVIYNINDTGIGAIQTSQANSMTTNGVPNDLIGNFNPLTIIIFIPILNSVIMPLMKKCHINYRPVYRIFTGFILASFASFAGAIIQWKVYETSPCGYYATDCHVGTGVSPITVWVECVVYILAAVSECFANTASQEIAYARAPVSMKGLIMALQLFTMSLSAAISEALTSVLIDPHLIWPFVGIGAAGVVSAIVFLIIYWNLHKVMDQERIEKEEQLKREALEKVTGSSSDLDLQEIESFKVEFTDESSEKEKSIRFADQTV